MRRTADANTVVSRLTGGRTLLLAAVCATVMAVPVGAQAASSSHAPAHSATRSPASICNTISAASVSEIIGYTVPQPTFDTYKLKPTKTNDEISAVVISCTFGSESSVAALTKDVTLDLEVTSKPITTAEVQQALKSKATAALKLTFSPYPGLGVPALYFTESGGGITAEGISAIVGTRSFGAAVYATIATAKLAALTKLAEKL